MDLVALTPGVPFSYPGIVETAEIRFNYASYLRIDVRFQPFGLYGNVSNVWNGILVYVSNDQQYGGMSVQIYSLGSTSGYYKEWSFPVGVNPGYSSPLVIRCEFSATGARVTFGPNEYVVTYTTPKNWGSGLTTTLLNGSLTPVSVYVDPFTSTLTEYWDPIATGITFQNGYPVPFTPCHVYGQDLLPPSGWEPLGDYSPYLRIDDGDTYYTQLLGNFDELPTGLDCVLGQWRVNGDPGVIVSDPLVLSGKTAKLFWIQGQRESLDSGVTWDTFYTELDTGVTTLLGAEIPEDEVWEPQIIEVIPPDEPGGEWSVSGENLSPPAWFTETPGTEELHTMTADNTGVHFSLLPVVVGTSLRTFGSGAASFLQSVGTAVTPYVLSLGSYVYKYYRVVRRWAVLTGGWVIAYEVLKYFAGKVWDTWLGEYLKKWMFPDDPNSSSVGQPPLKPVTGSDGRIVRAPDGKPILDFEIEPGDARDGGYAVAQPGPVLAETITQIQAEYEVSIPTVADVQSICSPCQALLYAETVAFHRAQLRMERERLLSDERRNRELRECQLQQSWMNKLFRNAFFHVIEWAPDELVMPQINDAGEYVKTYRSSLTRGQITTQQFGQTGLSWMWSSLVHGWTISSVRMKEIILKNGPIIENMGLDVPLGHLQLDTYRIIGSLDTGGVQP